VVAMQVHSTAFKKVKPVGLDSPEKEPSDTKQMRTAETCSFYLFVLVFNYNKLFKSISLN
jgi:hypothetical protein